DVVAVHEAVQEAVGRARAHAGPTLIEALTYRVSGHYVSEQPAYQNTEEAEAWRRRDPLLRLQRHIASQGLLDSAAAAQLGQNIRETLAKAMRVAQADPEPGAEALGEAQVFAPVAEVTP